MSLGDNVEQARQNEALGLPVGVTLAPIWRRVLGQILDQLVILVPVVVFALLIGVRNSDDLSDKAFAINVAVVVVGFTYELAMISQWGRTVGKFALGTRVVRVDTGGPVPPSSAAIRALVPLAASVIPAVGEFLSLVIYAGAFWDRRRRGWHDKAAGTIVILAR
ncbi:MAG: hypothetical protein JWM34_853 [Ilumatobacteraceae bacterium]|nr:hypothetical protein [Ilumatobacteraceae bacterium]